MRRPVSLVVSVPENVVVDVAVARRELRDDRRIPLLLRPAAAVRARLVERLRGLRALPLLLSPAAGDGNGVVVGSERAELARLGGGDFVEVVVGDALHARIMRKKKTRVRLGSFLSSPPFRGSADDDLFLDAGHEPVHPVAPALEHADRHLLAERLDREMVHVPHGPPLLALLHLDRVDPPQALRPDGLLRGDAVEPRPEHLLSLPEPLLHSFSLS